MSDAGPPAFLLVAGAALHLGFQLTVTLVVYPALAEAPDFSRAHRAHSRRITPVVVVVYAALLAGLGSAMVEALTAEAPAGGVLLAALGGVASLGLTALVAAPLHGRLAQGRDDALVRRLLVADRLRTVGATACLAGAVIAVPSWPV